MKISCTITVCNEFVEIQKLIPFLLKHKRHEDDIVVLYDSKNGNPKVEEFLAQNLSFSNSNGSKMSSMDISKLEKQTKFFLWW